jgi:hypothetical protein
MNDGTLTRVEIVGLDRVERYRRKNQISHD